MTTDPTTESVIDLCSDTVTRPSAAMRRAMADAEVGDDVLDGDPTVARLEARVAELLGKARAMFFPSGTMANQAAVWLLARRGTEALVDADPPRHRPCGPAGDGRRRARGRGAPGLAARAAGVARVPREHAQRRRRRGH